MLDEAVAYIAQNSGLAAEGLLTQILEAAATLDAFSERGRVVPELNHPSVRELLLRRYRLHLSGDALRSSHSGLHPRSA